MEHEEAARPIATIKKHLTGDNRDSRERLNGNCFTLLPLLTPVQILVRKALTPVRQRVLRVLRASVEILPNCPDGYNE
jgi:hypothetical protein